MQMKIEQESNKFYWTKAIRWRGGDVEVVPHQQPFIHVRVADKGLVRFP